MGGPRNERDIFARWDRDEITYLTRDEQGIWDRVVGVLKFKLGSVMKDPCQPC